MSPGAPNSEPRSPASPGRRSVPLRAAAILFHRWLGLSLGVILALVALSGSLIAYGPELTAWLHPEIAGPPPTEWQAARADILATLEHRYAPGEVAVLRFPHESLGAYELYLEGDRNHYLDALSGKLLLERTLLTDPVMLAREFHTHLLGGETGELVLGWLGVASLALLGTGLWLWWPRTGFRRVWRLPRSGRTNHLLLYWHKTIGVATLALTFFVTLTGSGLVFYGFSQGLLTGLLGGSPPTITRKAPRVQADWEQVVETVDGALTSGRLVFFYPPAADGDALLFRKQMTGELHPNGRSFVVTARDGRLVDAVDDRESAAGIRATHALYPLHAGRTGAAWWTLLVTASGLLYVGFFVTGLWTWLLRRPRPREARRLVAVGR